jgi:hypothetical protein
MSYLLELPCRPLPPNARSPPYLIFGINGVDVTSFLPPLIPFRLVLHFAPALQKWLLPSPDPADLPHPIACQSLFTPYIGINILASIDAVGLHWIITRMLHLSGTKLPKEAFSVYPNLTTSLAIHNTWLALDLPLEGLRNLHTHIHTQLMLSSPPVSSWDMYMLWDAFPHDSQIVRAMGLSFVEGHINLEYKVNESMEILAWLQSTPELCAFFRTLQNAVERYKETILEIVQAAEGKETIVGTGYQKIGKKAGKQIKEVVAKEATIMERGVTRKVSSQERQEREESDYEALKSRLRRVESDDSLRSVDTAIWDPETPEEKEDDRKKDELVNDDMNDSNNYSGGEFSAELTKTLEIIRLRRETRRLKTKSSPQPATDLTTANLERHSTEDRPRLRYRRSLSSTTTGKEHGLSIADLERRIQALKEKQNKLAQETKKQQGREETRIKKVFEEIGKK